VLRGIAVHPELSLYDAMLTQGAVADPGIPDRAECRSTNWHSSWEHVGRFTVPVEVKLPVGSACLPHTV